MLFVAVAGTTYVFERFYRRIRSALCSLIMDFRNDRILRYILLLVVLFTGFWFWYRVPNFGTPDEYSRLIDPMKAAGRVAADPGIEAFREGILDGRALGATFYLYGLTLVPIGLYVIVTGQLGTFAALGSYTSRWTLWFAAPAWFWTAAILLARLAVICFAIGCVYLTYVLGRELVDSTAGRLSAAFLTLSFGFVSTAHEAGEDIPMLFFFLLALLFTVRYLDDGRTKTFLAASLFGGIAIALKLTAGIIVFLLGGSLAVRVARGDDPLGDVVRPFAFGVLAGTVAIFVGVPSVLVGGPEELLVRVTGAAGQKVTAQTGTPIWYWLLKQYLSTFGLPLFIAVVAGVIASVWRWIHFPRRERHGELLLLGGLVCYLLVFYQWGYVRVHHLLPTVPLLAVLLGIELSRRVELRADRAARIAVAFLLLSSGLFVIGGIGHYASDPRSSTTEWLNQNAEQNVTVEVYENSIADVGVPRRLTISRYAFVENTQSYNGSLVRNESAFTAWMQSMPERNPAYIELTDRELRYLNSERYPERGDYIRSLLQGGYGYDVAARYGPGKRQGGRLERLIRAGVFAYPEKMPRQVVVLNRTGAS